MTVHAENEISEEDEPAAFAHWIAEKTGGLVPSFEEVEETETDVSNRG
jgi:hypothetical protein